MKKKIKEFDPEEFYCSFYPEAYINYRKKMNDKYPNGWEELYFGVNSDGN